MKTTITKALLVMEDIATGVGKVKQVRNGQEMELYRVDVAVAVLSEEDLKEIDVSVFTLAKVGEVQYRYNSLAITGVKSAFAEGYWTKVHVPLDAFESAKLPDAASMPYVQLALIDSDGKPSPVVVSTGSKWVYLDNTDV